MSCYLIKVENGHKVARSITSEEEYKQLRGSNEQKANLRLARAGNDAAKRRLVQFNYSGHYPQRRENLSYCSTLPVVLRFCHGRMNTFLPS